MSIQSQAVDTIIKNINGAIESYCNSLPYDKTYKMTIHKILENDKYTVFMAGQLKTASPLNNVKYNVGDSVYVLAPMGNFANLIILGKIS